MHHYALGAGLLLLISCGPGEDSGEKPDPTTTPIEDCVPTPLDVTWDCVIGATPPDGSESLGCEADFETMASCALSDSAPLAMKIVVDRFQGDKLYYLESKKYPLHWQFVDEYLLGNGLPNGDWSLSEFNEDTYYNPNRRFIVATITWYREIDVWALEFAPYDTAGPELLELTYRLVRESSFLHDRLQLHPSGVAQEALVPDLDPSVCTVSSAKLFEGLSYEARNVGESTGKLVFKTAAEVDGVPIDFREIVVLDEVPNDIGITAGIITSTYQTPLAHINVLAHNRGTPNMILLDAWENEDLRALEGKWVRLRVDPDDYTISEITAGEAQQWWEENRPDPLGANPPDLTVTDITLAVDILDFDPADRANTLGPAIVASIPAFGGKATHFGGLVHIGPEVPTPDGFAVPIYWYWRFMDENSWTPVEGGPVRTYRDTLEMWMDPSHPDHDARFKTDAQYRQDLLHALQISMVDEGELPSGFTDQLLPILATYPDRDFDFDGEAEKVRMRYRSSTNAEDLGNFTGAGLYASHAGIWGDENEPADIAIKSTWASVWNPRAYDEREYFGIDHLQVGMALLCHPSFPNEEANGVAITRNVLGDELIEPAFFVNVQVDGWSVVLPDLGVKSDAITYHFTKPNSPAVFADHSNLIPEGYRVLSAPQLFELGTALQAIHVFFLPVYGDRPNYAMDTEFKFDDDDSADGTRLLYMKQARPFAGAEVQLTGTCE